VGRNTGTGVAEEYLDLAHRYYSTRPMSPEAADILQKWEYDE
jgi:hypothetical protein